MKSKMRRALGFPSEARESTDTQALLSCAEKEDNREARNENLDWVPLTTLPQCKSPRTMAAISRYMELTIEPVQQWDPEDVNFEGNKDNMEMLRCQMHRCFVSPADLTSDE